MEKGIPETSQDNPRTPTRQPSRFKAMLIRRATPIRWVSVALILVAAVLLMRTLPLGRALESVQGWIDSLGFWGPVALGVIYIVAVLLLIPASLLTLAAGALYGLLGGTIIASLASTTGAALAFLVARYIARDKVRRRIKESPKLAAVDEAIGEQGWKIVALLRLSPAVAFNLQNYLYGVTAIRFWPCVLASWIAMLPGTFLYVYLGSLGKTAAAGEETSTAEWTARGVGLVATVAVTVYLARLARNAIESRTKIEDEKEDEHEHPSDDQPDDPRAASDEYAEAAWPWSTLLTAILTFPAISSSLC